MARKGITYDQVANVAREIKARGQEPTLSAIRVELGNEGSFTTISTHLAKWRQEEAERVDIKAIPPEVEQEMLKAITTVWNVASKAASEDMAALRQAHADQEKKDREELDYAKAEIKRLEEQRAKAEEEAAAAKGQTAALEKKLTATVGELEGIKALYAQLLQAMKPTGATVKPPSTPGTKGERTKQERQPATTAAPGKTPGEGQ